MSPVHPNLRLLVAESEPPETRAKRRASVGRSSGETYLDVLQRLSPGAVCDRVFPTDTNVVLPVGVSLVNYDAVLFTGSPLHLYEETPETRRTVDFMRAVFEAGTPAFGSCAGLQIATVAAGGSVRPNARRPEAGFARRITPTEAGRRHPLLAGRPAAYDAPSIHTDEIETLPPGAVLLAENSVTAVQAAAIRYGRGWFWGIQYHPEIGLDEVAGALRRQADGLVEAGLARGRGEVEAYVVQVDALHRDPRRRDLAWRLGLDEQITDERLRLTELRNFVGRILAAARTREG